MRCRTRIGCVCALALLTVTRSYAGDADSARSDARVTGPHPRARPAPSTEAIAASVRRGVAYLVGKQNPDGSWGSARRTKGLNIYAPVPGAHHAFRTATTALCVSALIETAPGDAAAVAAVDRAEAWLIERLPRLRRATPTAIYNVWGHAYALRALSRLHERTGAAVKKRRFVELAEQQVDMLRRYESVDGGWGYYDFDVGAQRPTSSAISFTTATVIIGFKEAQAIGVDIPRVVLDRAVWSIERQQKPDFSYLYGEYLKDRPQRLINRPGGSLGRSQVCNLALRLWGDASVTDHVIETWLRRLVARNMWLDIGRKRPVPHEAWFQVAGYFYYYGHYYAAQCIELLPAARRGPHQGHLARILLGLQEKDGSWWDYPLYDYHQPYGTAYALMSLGRCLPVAEH